MGTQPLLISVGSAGQKGNDDSYFAQAVGDGRYALFVSDARNLSDSDGNGRSTFLHDTVDGWTAVVDIGPDGQAANSSSEWRGLGVQNPTDPLDVAFSSQGFGTGFNLYYRDVEAGTTVLIAEDISKFDYPLPVNGETWHYGHFAFSPDGKFLSFASSNDSLVPNDSNNRTDIFLKNLETGDVSRVSTAADGEQSDGHSYRPVFSADGKLIAFYSDAENLGPDDSNGRKDVYIKDLETGAVTLVTRGHDGSPANGDSIAAQFSSDGRYLLIESAASNLVENDTNGRTDVFLYDTQDESITRVSELDDGEGGNRDSIFSFFLPNSDIVGFITFADNLLPDDSNNARDVVFTVIGSGEFETLDFDGPVQPNDDVLTTGISGDGNYAFLTTEATNLAPGDTDRTRDIVRVPLSQLLISKSIRGTDDGEELLGTEFADYILGFGGADNIDGGEGDDLIEAGPGDDDVTGGPGEDRFVLNPGDGADIINDFEVGIDLLDLEGFDRADAITAVSNAQAGSVILTFPDGTTVTLLGIDLDDFSFSDVAIENSAPDDIRALSSLFVAENSPVGTVISLFEADDADIDEDHTYSIVHALSDPTSHYFKFDGDALVVSETADLDFEADSSHQIVIQVEDPLGGSYQGTFTVRLTNVFGETIYGTPDEDYLQGTPENDFIYALASDDLIDGAGGSDRIDGDEGRDTVIYDGIRDAYDHDLQFSGRVLVDKPDGYRDTLLEIERIDFNDGSLLYDVDTPNLGFGYRIYQASFDRTPDEGGVLFWIGVLDDLDNQGWSQYDKEQFLASQFIQSDEFKDLFGANPTNEEYIDAMYQNVLDRLPDQGGYDFWVGGMVNDGLTREDILIAFTKSDENVDRTAPDLDDGVWVV